MTRRLKWISSAAMLAWLCLAGWIVFDLNTSYQREFAAAEKVTATLNKALDIHLRTSVQKLDFRLRQLVSQYQYAVASNAPREVLEKELHDSLAFFPEASSFRVANAAGNYLYDANGILSPANIADRDYFRRLRDEPDAGLIISELIKSRVSGEWVIVLARRLEDHSGQFAGIVLAAVKTDYFEQFYRSLDLGRNGIVSFWSSDQHLIARWPHDEQWLDKHVGNTQLGAALAAGRSSGVWIGASHVDGIRRLYQFRSIEGLPFALVVGLSEDEILAGWKHRLIMYGWLGGGLTMALLVLFRLWIQGYRRAKSIAEEMVAAFERKDKEARALLDAIPDPAWLLDTSGCFLAVNEAYCRFLGRPMSAVIGHTVDDLFSVEEAQHLRTDQLEVYQSRVPVRKEIWLKIDGVMRPLEFLRVAVDGADGEPRGLAGVARDMTAHYEAEARQRLITLVFDHSSEAILVLDSERRIVTFNKAVTELFGYQLDDVKGLFARSLAVELQSPELFQAVAYSLDHSGIWRGELMIQLKGGGICPVACRVTAIRDDAGEVTNWLVFVNDLSETKAAEARIESLANVDQMTSLPNRQGFSRRLDEWLDTGQPCAVITLGLDQLSRINDEFGRAAGDRMLTQISERLRAQLRDTDVLGRLGGDKFAVILPRGSNVPGLEIVVKKLLDVVVHPIHIDGSEVVPAASAGLCFYPEDGKEASVLLRNADVAMHLAKDEGQSAYCFYGANMRERWSDGLRLESDLRLALQRNQLVLHYQPQLDVRSGQLTGFESLLRWEHPEMGRIPPDRFISLAENSKLILPIGDWVLGEACRQNKEWQNAGFPPVVVAVNLSAVQFHGPDLVATVERALRAADLSPQWLELEITESVVMQDPERVVRILENLKSLGIRLSLDDFGTGYSSLSYLKRFPLDKIKIDRSFIRDIASDPGDAAIVRMVIGMARELEHGVIAEGVETADQLAFLLEHGCQEYQGFYCSKAVPAGEVGALIKSLNKLAQDPRS